MTANPSTAVRSNIHGAIIAGGGFNASALNNLNNAAASSKIVQNSCMANQMIGTFLKLAYSEM